MHYPVLSLSALTVVLTVTVSQFSGLDFYILSKQIELRALGSSKIQTYSTAYLGLNSAFTFS